MFSTTSFDRLMTMLGMFCRDELRREGIGAVLPETADNDREYLARHDVLPEWWSRLSGRGRFDELAVRVRDYPGPLPANVQENRAAFDELKTILKELELDTERPEPEIWGRLEVLRKQIQDGAKVPMGEVVKAKKGGVNPAPVRNVRGRSFVLGLPEFARLLIDEPTSYEWSALQVAGHIGCSKPTILRSELWQLVLQKRAEKKTEQTARAESPRPKTKADHNRQQMLDRKDNLLEKLAES